MSTDPEAVPGEQAGPTPLAVARLALPTTRDAVTAAEHIHRQAIRDAHDVGVAITDIAAAIGVANRRTAYAAINAAPPDRVDPPQARPVVFLRGAGQPAALWQDITTAMHRRGWLTVRDRQQAWHLARGRIPVVLVDFSASNPPRSQAVVGRVEAKYGAATAGRSASTELPLTGNGQQVPVDPQALAQAVTLELWGPAAPPAAGS